MDGRDTTGAAVSRCSYLKSYAVLGVLLQRALVARGVSTTLASWQLVECSNAGTCGPSFCSLVNNGPCTPQEQNITKTEMMRRVGLTGCKTCAAAPTDPRCTSAALLAVFGKFPGMKAAYCNEDFIVLQADGSPNHAGFLDKIQRPPGGGTGAYESQCVTRSMVTQQMVYKIPLRPVALSTASGLVNNVASFTGNMLPANSGAALPVAGPASVTVTGTALFPPQNNNGEMSWTSCEMDLCNAHVGRGFDYHYHGDPFGSSCMYSQANYTGGSARAHPPLIGYGLDGFPLYGRHLSVDAPGYGNALDDCGGHDHTGTDDPYAPQGYHYHAQIMEMPFQSGQTYVAYVAGPYKCWKGDISRVTNFWTGSGANAQASFGAGNLAQRSDYVQVQPCCNAPGAYWNADGAAVSSPAAQPPTGGGGGGRPAPTGVARLPPPAGAGAAATAGGAPPPSTAAGAAGGAAPAPPSSCCNYGGSPAAKNASSGAVSWLRGSATGGGGVAAASRRGVMMVARGTVARAAASWCAQAVCVLLFACWLCC